MKAKNAVVAIALILAVIATLLFLVIPASANLTVAYVFTLIGIVLMACGFLLATTKNVPASFALIGQMGRFLPVSVAVSVIVLVLERIGIFTLPTLAHVVIQVIVMAISALRLAKIAGGAAYINEVEKEVAVKRNAWVELTNQATMMAAREQNAESKAALQKVVDALRYADPMTVKASQNIETRIELLLEQACGENCKTNCDELLLLIQERNMIVKANK